MRFLALAVLTCVVGCGDGGGRVPVSGKITLDGSPVEGATVTFIPDENTPTQGSFARTGADGQYAVGHPEIGMGLAAGTYKVTVTRIPAASPGDEAGLIDAPIRGGGGWPVKYTHPDTTPLRAKVEPGAKRFDFNLVSTGADSIKKP